MIAVGAAVLDGIRVGLTVGVKVGVIVGVWVTVGFAASVCVDAKASAVAAASLSRCCCTRDKTNKPATSKTAITAPITHPERLIDFGGTATAVVATLPIFSTTVGLFASVGSVERGRCCVGNPSSMMMSISGGLAAVPRRASPIPPAASSNAFANAPAD